MIMMFHVHFRGVKAIHNLLVVVMVAILRSIQFNSIYMAFPLFPVAITNEHASFQPGA